MHSCPYPVINISAVCNLVLSRPPLLVFWGGHVVILWLSSVCRLMPELKSFAALLPPHTFPIACNLLLVALSLLYAPSVLACLCKSVALAMAIKSSVEERFAGNWLPLPFLLPVCILYFNSSEFSNQLNPHLVVCNQTFDKRSVLYQAVNQLHHTYAKYAARSSALCTISPLVTAALRSFGQCEAV